MVLLQIQACRLEKAALTNKRRECQENYDLMQRWKIHTQVSYTCRIINISAAGKAWDASCLTTNEARTRSVAALVPNGSCTMLQREVRGAFMATWFSDKLKNQVWHVV
jgi:hypothetical protein